MDAETVVWMAEQLCALDWTGVPLLSVPRERVLTSWNLVVARDVDYEESKIAEGIHGVMHSTRTMLIAHWIGVIGNTDSVPLAVAARWHDTRRQNDQEDLGHGARAARKIAKTHMESRGCSAEQLATAVKMMRYHDVPTGSISPTYLAAHFREITTFKAVDALDRFRLPKVKWWPQPTKIEYQPALALAPYSAAVVVLSEALRLTLNSHPVDAVTQAYRWVRANQEMTPYDLVYGAATSAIALISGSPMTEINGFPK